LKIVRMDQKTALAVIERAVAEGDTVLIENIHESINPVLDNILGRNTIKKGTAVRIGEREIEWNPKFRLILHTKLANPHYKPEMQAQTTLINFSVTLDGLEDQLLASVVAQERPDLEQLKTELTQQQNEYKITLKQLEDTLLRMLSEADENILGDVELVETLEKTKSTSIEIEQKVILAKKTEIEINRSREDYRPVGRRAAVAYFVVNSLCKINPIYQFSLKAFTRVFVVAMENALPAEDELLATRMKNLIDSVTYEVFVYANRALFERDKMIFLAHLTFSVLQDLGEIKFEELDFLMKYPAVLTASPVDFLNEISWGGIKALAEMDEFKGLDKDIEGSAKRWKKFVDSDKPEKEVFPQEWKNKSGLQKLCMMRALRPDRMTYAVSGFIEVELGEKYTEGKQVEFSKSYTETSPANPVFFILSPGVDPLKDVEKLGKQLGFTEDNMNLHSVSLGQGQEVVADTALKTAAENGHWVVLQNVHLVAKWLPTLERNLEKYASDSRDEFRVYISGEPAADPAYHILPQGILEDSVKITNESPTGIRANLHAALNCFNQEYLEKCQKETEFKTILFAMCYFHAVVCERRKFGPQGWNRVYPFNYGDLTISAMVLFNYLEANNKVPYEDLRYLFGEIMYGGHITDDWDRRLCKFYLEEYVDPELLEGELYFAKDFLAPPNSDYLAYHQYIKDHLPPESPNLYGLHGNAEIGFLTATSDRLFKTILEIAAGSGGGGAGSMSREEIVKEILDSMMDQLPEEFDMIELSRKAEDRTPYTIVCLQECERISLLIREIRRSLKELNLGLKGELSITQDMDDLATALVMGKIHESWVKRAYPSEHELGNWYADLLQRQKELDNWTQDFSLPAIVWLGGLFNPQSMLTAIMQAMARKNEWPLDKMCLQVDVTKKGKEEFTAPPREGAYLFGMYMEGARWDSAANSIVDSRPKDLTPAMPVMLVRAIPIEKMETKGVYDCPVYKTKVRGPTFVWTFNLKTKERAAKWVLGGVALLLQI